MGVTLGPKIRKVEVNILTSGSYIIIGKISVPEEMRFSDALNKFLKDTKFLPVLDIEIRNVNNEKIGESDFSLINKDLIIAIYPVEKGL
ncbi:MAG: DUF6812 domain-containing protein [Caldisericia bacterium]